MQPVRNLFLLSNSRHIIASALLALFVTYTTAYLTYRHVHVVDGVIVVHSHPFSEDADNHSHTTQQLTIIDQLGHLHYLQHAFAEIEQVQFKEWHTAETFYRPLHDLLVGSFSFNLRAPPFTFGNK